MEKGMIDRDGLMLRNAVFAWTPNLPPCHSHKSAGELRVLNRVQAGLRTDLISTIGADGFGWRSTTDADRHQRLAQMLVQWLEHDNIAPFMVSTELLGITDLDFAYIFEIVEASGTKRRTAAWLEEASDVLSECAAFIERSSSRRSNTEG